MTSSYSLSAARDRACPPSPRDARAGDQPGRALVQDTAWAGYEQVPAWIVPGYQTLLDEVVAISALDLDDDAVVVLLSTEGRTR
jgi:hypothetical protein